MEIVKKEISLNVGQPNNFEMICAMQGDNKSFEITATLYDVNDLYNITTDNIRLKGINANKEDIYLKIDSHTDNTVTFLLNEQILAYDGLVKLVLVFTDSSEQLTTFPFIIRVINSPGNGSNSDFKSISALVEEAEKWANLSKSYAVGTNDTIRNGDSTDNSKYYYEQSKLESEKAKESSNKSEQASKKSQDAYDKIQKLLDGNSKVVYYDTYDDFKADLDAGNIDDETLICIKEEVVIEKQNDFTITVTDITSNSVSLSWEMDASNIDYIDIYYGLDNKVNDDILLYNSIRSHHSDFGTNAILTFNDEVHSLNPNTTYYFIMYVTDTNNKKLVSNVVSATTLAT